MTRKAVWTGAVALLILMGPMGAEAQRGGGGGKGGGGLRGGGTRDQGAMQRPTDGHLPKEIRDKIEALKAFPVDRMWSALSFGVGLPDTQLVTLKPLFTDSWARKQHILAAAEESKDWEEAKDELKRLEKQLDRKLKTVLTKDQRKSAEKLIKKQEKLSRVPMTR